MASVVFSSYRRSEIHPRPKKCPPPVPPRGRHAEDRAQQVQAAAPCDALLEPGGPAPGGGEGLGRGSSGTPSAQPAAGSPVSVGHGALWPQRMSRFPSSGPSIIAL